MRAVLAFTRAYPGQSAAVLTALIVAGLVEGVSLTALLPALSAALETGGIETSGKSGTAVELLRRFGIDPTVTTLLVVMVVGTTLTSAIGLVAKRQVGYTVAQVATDLRLDLLRALVAARWEYYLRQPVGKLINALASEAGGASMAYLSAATMMASAIQAVVYAGVAFAVSWRATLAYIFAALLIASGLHRLVRAARQAGKRSTKMLSRLMVGLVDSLVSVKPLKAMARESLADGVIAAQTQELNLATRRQVIAKEARKAIQSIAFSMLVAAGAWAGLKIYELPMATVIVLMLLLSKVLSNFGKVQADYQEMVSCESYYWALQRTLGEARREIESQTGTIPPRLEREIRLDHVGFSYSDSLVLDDCSIEIPFGSFTALIGPSGAGKTTLLDLVVGLVRPQKGRVLVDGEDLGQLEMRAWRRMIGYVPQENLLLHDSVAENVTLGDPELGPADVAYALRAAGAWDFVSSLPEGPGTVVGERGARFSGGQRQRIMIARALAHRPRLLILDEATASLDPETEASLCESLAALRGEITVLAISHQRALVDAADRVYRIEKGSASLEIDRPELRTAPPARAASRA
jgi:ATP-binding cassette subfamily C protein